MIRLTNANEIEYGQPLYVHPDDIKRCKDQKGIRAITAIKDANGEWFYVTESPQEVTRKVLEWQLAMERYKAMAIAWASEKDTDYVAERRYDMEEIRDTLCRLG